MNIMASKISITLDESLIDFIDSQSNNRSQFINKVLVTIKKQQELENLKQAYIEQSQDRTEEVEIALWDCTVGDGLEDESY